MNLLKCLVCVALRSLFLNANSTEMQTFFFFSYLFVLSHIPELIYELRLKFSLALCIICGLQVCPVCLLSYAYHTRTATPVILYEDQKPNTLW